MTDNGPRPSRRRWKRRAFGHIFLRGRSWYIKFRRQGRVVVRAVGPTRAMADARLAQLHVAILTKERLGIVEPKKVSFGEFWPVLEPVLRARLAPASYATDKSRYRVIEQFFGARPIESVTASDIEDFRCWMRNNREHKGRKAQGSTTNRYLALFSIAFKEAIRRDCAVANPVLGVKRVREEQRSVPYLSRAAIERIASVCVPALRPLVIVAADTGLRRGELLALEWRDVEFGRGVLTVRHSKSKRPRDVPLTSSAKNTLVELHAAREVQSAGSPDYVFHRISNLAPSWAKTFVASRFRMAARAAGFPEITFHGLRHAYCSRLAQAGVPLATIKALAGHGSLAITNRYACHVPHGAEAAAVRKLEIVEGTCPAGEARP